MRKIREYIKKIKTFPESEYKKILLLISNIIILISNFQGVSKLMTTITKDKSQTAWAGTYNLMDVLNDDFYSDRDLFKLITSLNNKINSKTVNVNDLEKKFIEKLIEKFERMGCGMSTDNQLKFLKIRDLIIQYKNNITSFITTGTPIEYCEVLSPIKQYKKISPEKVKYINLTLSEYNKFMTVIENEQTRKYINNVMTDYTSLIIPKLIKLNIYKYNYSKFLGYSSFSKLVENNDLSSIYKNCMWDKIAELINKTKLTCVSELRNIQDFGKNTIYNINFGFEQKKKELLKSIFKYNYINILSSISEILLLLKPLFNFEFEKVNDIQIEDKNIVVFKINNEYLYIGTSGFEKDKSDIIIFNHNPISIMLTTGLPENITFADVVELGKKISVCICILLKTNKYILLNEISNDDVYFINCLVEMYLNENISTFIKTTDTHVISKILELNNIRSSFDLIHLCTLSIIDNYMSTDYDYIKQSKNLIQEKSKSVISTSNKIICNFITEIFNDTPYKTPEKIQPDELLELMDNFEGKLYYKVIIKLISTNIWNKYNCKNNIKYWNNLIESFKNETLFKFINGDHEK